MKNDECMHRRIDCKISLSLGEMSGKSLYLEPQYICMIIACVCCIHLCLCVCNFTSSVCMRSHADADACVLTRAPARMCVMRSRSPASGFVAGAMHGGSRRVVLTCLFVCLLCTGNSICAASHHRLGELITVRRSGTTRR